MPAFSSVAKQDTLRRCEDPGPTDPFLWLANTRPGLSPHPRHPTMGAFPAAPPPAGMGVMAASFGPAMIYVRTVFNCTRDLQCSGAPIAPSLWSRFVCKFLPFRFAQIFLCVKHALELFVLTKAERYRELNSFVFPPKKLKP